MEYLDVQDTLILLGAVAVSIAIICFFLITIQNTLKLVEPQNRKMQPGNVWLLLIPVFGFIWSFIMVNAIANSCKIQLEQYGLYYEQKPTYSAGIGWCFCLVLSIVIKLFSVVAIVLLIVYWIKVNDTRKLLINQKQLYESRDASSIL